MRNDANRRTLYFILCPRMLVLGERNDPWLPPEKEEVVREHLKPTVDDLAILKRYGGHGNRHRSMIQACGFTPIDAQYSPWLGNGLAPKWRPGRWILQGGSRIEPLELDRAGYNERFAAGLRRFLHSLPDASAVFTDAMILDMASAGLDFDPAEGSVVRITLEGEDEVVEHDQLAIIPPPDQ